MPIQNIENFHWWLSLVEPSNLDDNQFEVLTNMFYNKDKRIQTRRWIKTFGTAIWTNPISSYFFFQRDDNWTRIAICVSGTQMYKYNEWTTVWDSIKTWLTEFEADGTTRTRWSFAVYKNVIYMWDWVNAYASYDWTTYTELWVTSVWTCTFDNTTETITKATHWLSIWDSVKFTSSWTLPAEITSGQYYFVISVPTGDTFTISKTANWTVLDFTDDWTWTHTLLKTSQPRVRYLQYMWDRIFWAWDDTNPSSLYYTASLPADATDITTNVLVVWWDELGRINWLKEIWQIILAFKSDKIYSIDVATPTSNPIDSQNGGYSHRAIKNVENGLLYYNDIWVDSLKQRSWVTWSQALSAEPMTNDLRGLIEKITPKSYNYNTWIYISALTNYYFSFDTWNDRIPDTTLVRSNLTWGWSKYTLPAMYDYWLWIDSDWVYHYLMASANGWQMYEIESWFQDFWLWIFNELKTKQWDFKDSSIWKTFESVDIIWLKNEWSEIIVEILVDWDVISTATITDTMTDPFATPITIWVSPTGIEPLAWWSWTWEEVDLSQYIIRVPMCASWPNIQVRMYSEDNPNIWTLDKIKINYWVESMDIFSTANIG